MNRSLPLVVLATLGAAQAQTLHWGTVFKPDQWPALERVARQVPTFAGFSYRYEGENAVILPALTDPAQEEPLRAVLAADPVWSKQLEAWKSPPRGSLQSRTPVSKLLELAHQVKRVRPQATVRIDTTLGRVTVVAEPAHVRELAQQVGGSQLLVPSNWRPPLTVSYDVQPRRVSRVSLSTQRPFSKPSDLRVLVKNTGPEAVLFNYGCGGSLPVRVVTVEGQETPRIPNMGCTAELRERVIQPGEVVTFPSFTWNDLTKLVPGQYAWKYGELTFPFTLTR